MKLEEQSYQILDRGKIEIINHSDLLGMNKQIIRLREIFFLSVQRTLEKGDSVSLYNHYNPINSDLIKNFQRNKDLNNGAVIAKIVGDNNLGPILEGSSLKQVKIIEMFNVFFEDINDLDLQKSIVFNGKKGTVLDLIEWLSKEFYNGRLSTEDIEKYQRLFYRKIQN